MPDRIDIHGDEIWFRAHKIGSRPSAMCESEWEALRGLLFDADEDGIAQIRDEAYAEGRDTAFDEEIVDANASRLAKLKDKLKRRMKNERLNPA